MDFGLKGKRALVLGASQGLGAACAKELALEGASVIAAARNTEAIEKWVAEARLEEEVRAVKLDLADEKAVAAFAEEMSSAGIDIVVNNCGGPAAGPARGQSRAAWLAAFEAMALPVMQITDALLAGMAERGFGRVITIGSSGILSPIPGLALSNGVRGAIAGWSKTLASEVAGDGITVNMVLPGRIATDRVASLDAIKAKKQNTSVEAVEKGSKATIPAGRYGDPAEFAAVAAFLASARASFVNGSMIRVDGGMLKQL
ncbi:SDR family oxidoreductase [Martelella endophytica]|uniref:3-oxoacyl-ACP reductase n=1 Tax=Martelella endophytica TaxID=1486262 RepID=A0A0D5LQR6_MAREN|nr:SDR family oxidoreductase [Martelella endophytica]AJY46290.1 3-oxoacyl-ACP reductase [Martelella endophytica]